MDVGFQAGASPGGWLGDVLEGIKPDVIAGMGWKIRDNFGMPLSNGEPPIEVSAAPAPAAPHPTAAPQNVLTVDDVLLYGGLGLIGYLAFS